MGTLAVDLVNPCTMQNNSDMENMNAGWADCVSKILHAKKAKRKKSLVLSKAKKLNDIKVKKEKTVPAGFEVATQDGEIKKEEIKIVEPEVLTPKKNKRKELLPIVRTKPNILEKDRERTLSKIATKGVVQLFNAVKMQQNDISKKLKEAGPLEAKKQKVLESIDKRAFLKVLMAGDKPQVDDDVDAKSSNVSVKSKTSDSSTWEVLREDFMMNPNLKDWDKEDENEIENENMEFE